MYCIYSNKEFNDDEATLEHIIPLSLGGCNSFSIYVSKDKNSEYGSSIEGKISKDIFIQFLRMKNKIKGHTKKRPKVAFDGSNNGRPARLTIKGINDFKIYDFIEKRNVDAGALSLKGNLYPNLYIALMAKIILSAGYFKFGEKFNRCCDCNSLRFICDSVKNDEWIKKDLDVGYYLWCSPLPLNAQQEMKYFANFFAKTNSSGVVFNFVMDRLIAHVGIAGKHIGALNIHSDNQNLVNDDTKRLCMLVIEKEYIEQSLCTK